MTRYIAARPFQAGNQVTPLFEAIFRGMKSRGPNHVIMEDAERQTLTYRSFLQRTFALSCLFQRHCRNEAHVGLMLPTSLAGVVSFYALHAIGKVPVMINFTAGNSNIRSACLTGQVRTIITARRFVEIAKLHDLIKSMSAYAHVLYLEDLRGDIGISDKIYAAAAAAMPKKFIAKSSVEDIGVILFTSGSFGKPRGVVLSQANLVANTLQVMEHIDIQPDWIFFNPMPIFHSLGLIAGAILPPITGTRCFLYPSPLHVKQIPELVKSVKATVLFSTDTFLNQYARNAEADCFASLKFVVCGAEKVREETHQVFSRDYNGLPVLEGYGVTETSPVLAVNDPVRNVPGTVGRILPGIEARLEPVEGIADGGRLFVRGPNIMKGYIYEEDPRQIETPRDGWHDTGDIVNIDEQGYVRILGRIKRFAKIAGEMVSLTAVENMVEEMWPDNRHAVVAINDDKKGEKLVLITDNGAAEFKAVADWAKNKGVPAIALPKKVIKVSEIPVLGSGKTDYVALQRLADIDA